MANAKTATVIWKNTDLDFAGTLGSGYEFDLSGQAGPDTGASPMELLVAGLAGCTAMDVISILQKKRQNITSFEVHVHGERVDTHPMVYTDVTVNYIVRGHDIDETAVQRAIELSETKYCPVMATFRAANIPVSLTYKIENAAPA